MLPIEFVKTLLATKEGPDETLYEDCYIIVYRKNNQIWQKGKLIRNPFMYKKEG